ncbi:MAG: hypothetical protein ACI9K5_003297, partial [Gammaproteobacteria bacterium]
RVPISISTAAAHRAAGPLVLLAALALPLVSLGCGNGGGDGLAGGGGGEDDGNGGGDGGGGGGGSDSDFDDYAIQYGMNSSRRGYAYRTVVFADLMMRASEFGVANGTTVDLTSPVPTIPYGQSLQGEGWPDFAQIATGTEVGTRLLSAMKGSIPDGRTLPYVVEWQGSGNCDLRGTGVSGSTNRTTNRAEFFIDPTMSGNVDPGVNLVISQSAPSDPVRDVHIWLPGTESTRPLFWQPFVDKVEAMNDGKGPYIWRSMNWANVFNYGISDGPGAFTFDFKGRVTPRSPSQATRKGMCVEMIVAFANEIQRDVILNVPHRTDDMTEGEYSVFLLDLFDRAANGSPAVPGINGGQPFEGLDSGLHIWIELSNEIWNSGFVVNAWMNREADSKGLTYEQQVAGEIVKMNAAARVAFSGSGSDRLRLYIGSHIAAGSSLSKILQALPTGTQVDGVGPACYFSESNSDINSWLVGYDAGTGACPNCPTVTELLDAGRASIPLLANLVREQRAIITNYNNPGGLPPLMMLYESGQHYVAGGYPWSKEVNAIQVHPDLYSAYVDELIPTLIDEGVDVICWFSFMSDQSPNAGGALGPFGIWDTLDQAITMPVPDIYIDEQAPKAAAVYKGPPLLQ